MYHNKKTEDKLNKIGMIALTNKITIKEGKMIRQLLISISILSITGCLATSPKVANVATINEEGIKECIFDSIQSKALKLNEESKKYVSLWFTGDPNLLGWQQMDKSILNPVKNQPFKVVSTGYVTAENQRMKSVSTPVEEEINGVLYKKDTTYSAKVVTKDCSIFYLKTYEPAATLANRFIFDDDSDVTAQDILDLVLDDVQLEKVSLKAKIEYDRFKKQYDVQTPYFNKRLIRGAISEKHNNLIFVQLYTDLTFIDNWGHIRNAYDTYGNTHEVTKITSDSDCSNQYIGCQLTETIGVTLNLKFLKDNRNGFELKLTGTKEKEIKIPAAMVNSFLAGIAKATELTQNKSL